MTGSTALAPASPLPLWIGIGMALAAMLAALLVVATLGLSQFPMISQACSLNGLGEEACTQAAWRVGVSAVGAYAAVLVVGLYLHRSSRTPGTPASVAQHPTAVRLVLGVAIALLATHVLALVIGPAFASRSDESQHYAALVSLENLMWPLLVQLYVSQRDARLRACLLAILLLVMALSPYRAVLLAILVFGFVVPLIDLAWRSARASWPAQLRLLCARQGALALMVGLFAVWGGYVGTIARFPSLYVAEQAAAAQARAAKRDPRPSVQVEIQAQLQAERNAQRQAQAPTAPDGAVVPMPPPRRAGVVTAPPPLGVEARLAQRVAFPLYQAAIAGHLATVVPLPSLWNELGRKFRLSEEPTLEEFLFRRIYGGTGAEQTTTLYYGEAAAYFPGPPLVWMILGPLGIVAASLLFRRAAIPATTVFGIGLWRSSFSGLAPVLPAMVLQLTGLAIMAWLGRLVARWPRPGRLLATVARPAVTIGVGLLLVAQLWAIAATPARRTLVIANFSLAPGCVLVSPTWVTFRVDAALAERGMKARSSLAWVAGEELAVTLSLGARIEPALNAIADKIATLVTCAGEEPMFRVTPNGAQRFGAAINPLDGLAAAALLIALLRLTGAMHRRRPWVRRLYAAIVAMPERYAGLPFRQQMAVLAGLTLLFLGLAWGSHFSPLLAMIACASLLAVTAMMVPELGIFLVVVVTPVRAVFDLAQERMQLVLAVGLVAVALRHLPRLRSFPRERKPQILLVFATFILLFVARTVLELFQPGSDEPVAAAKELCFFLAVLAAAIASYSHAHERRFLDGLMVSVAIAVGLTILVDTISIYFPATAESLGFLKGFPGLRLAGLHVNPNATGKYLVLGVLLCCCVLWAVKARAAIGAALLGLVVAALAVSATQSKSALLAVFGALLAFAVFTGLRRQWRRTGMIAATALLVFVTVAGWYAGLAPVAQKFAIQQLVDLKKLAARSRPTDQTIAELVERELRIANSFSMRMETPSGANRPPNSEMYRKIQGSIVYTRRDCTWTCTGQRDLLWGTGIAIVAEHWLLGIGPHRWADEYLERLRFPFDTPHDGMLELWGGYGLAGAALYLVLIVQLLRMAARSFRFVPSAPQFVFLAGTSLYALATLIAELVDPAKFLAMSPHAVWLWIFLAAQARVLAAEPATGYRRP